MHGADLYPPGRVLWAVRDSNLHPSHRLSDPKPSRKESTRHGKSVAPEANAKDKLRLFEVLDVEKVFSQVVFAKDMLRYTFHSFANSTLTDSYLSAARICPINMIELCMNSCNQILYSITSKPVFIRLYHMYYSPDCVE